MINLLKMKTIPTIIVIILVAIGAISLALNIFGEGAAAVYFGGGLAVLAIAWVIANEK